MINRSRLLVVLLAGALAGPGCTTPGGSEMDCGELCSLTVFGVLAIPCGIAAGVGCIGGGITRCGEGAPQDQPPPETTTESVPSGAAASAMEY